MRTPLSRILKQFTKNQSITRPLPFGLGSLAYVTPTGTPDGTKFLRDDGAWAVPQAFPVGSVFIAVVATNPATLLGYGTWTAFGAGRVLVGLDSGDTDFDTAEETGGAKTVASVGTNAGTVVADHASHTHAVTSNVTVGNHAFTQPTISWPVGVPTNANESAHTHAAGAISWPLGVPTAANEGAHTHSVTSNVAVAAHSFTQPTISWPAGVPTFAGSALSTHAHELPIGKGDGGAVNFRQLDPDIFGTGTSRATQSNIAVTGATTAVNVYLSEAVSAGTPAGTISWPAGVPINASGAVDAHAVTNNAVTSGAGSNHTHAISWPGGTPNGADTGAGSAHTHSISWPAGVPTNAGGAVDAHNVTNNAVTSSGPSAALQHTVTTQPAFTGSPTSVVQPYITVYMWKRTA